MKVHEMISQLKQYDPQLEIMVITNEQGHLIRADVLHKRPVAEINTGNPYIEKFEPIELSDYHDWQDDSESSGYEHISEPYDAVVIC